MIIIYLKDFVIYKLNIVIEIFGKGMLFKIGKDEYKIGKFDYIKFDVVILKMVES